MSPRVRILALILTALIVAALLTFALTRSSGTETAARDAVHTRAKALSEQLWLGVDIEFSGYTTVGTMDPDGIITAETTHADTTFAILKTATDTYIEGDDQVWAALGIEGHYRGWVHTPDSDVLPSTIYPLPAEVASVATAPRRITVSGEDVVFPEFRARTIGDKGLRVTSGHMSITYRPATFDVGLEENYRHATSTPARIVVQGNGQRRIDAPMPSPDMPEPVQPAPDVEAPEVPDIPDIPAPE